MSRNSIANDIMHIIYWVLDLSNFQNHHVSKGGGGFTINSGARFIPTDIIVGAVSGFTDDGPGSFDTNGDGIFLLANGHS